MDVSVCAYSQALEFLTRLIVSLEEDLNRDMMKMLLRMLLKMLLHRCPLTELN